MQETRARSLGWEDRLEEDMATSVFLPEKKSQGQRSLVGYSARGCEETDTTPLLSTLLVAALASWFFGR